MDNSSTSWFFELGMEDPFCSEQFDIMDFLDEEYLSAVLVDQSQKSLNIPISSSVNTLCVSSTSMEAPPVAERPAKQHKPNNYNSWTIQNKTNLQDQAGGFPRILTFGNPDTPELMDPQLTIGTSLNPEDDAASQVLTSKGSFVNLKEATKSAPTTTKKSGGRSRPASQTYDHIIAERKRREQLSKQFVALSTMVPGLKKMDKTSVLGDTIKYLKHLQERVKTLEEQPIRQTMESVVLVRKSQLLVEDEGSSDEMGNPYDQEHSLPEIEAKMCDKTVLLRVHCENHKGLLVKLLSEIEKLNLIVTNISVTPFGSLAVDITIFSEMEKEFNLTMNELARSLRCTLQRRPT